MMHQHNMFTLVVLVLISFSGVSCIRLPRSTGCDSISCENDGICTNDDNGDYVCECANGFTGDTCEDICQSDCSTCSDTTTCSSCNSGYFLDLNNTCHDIDECLMSNGYCNANASCTNSQGSYSCTCNDGYYGDGLTCTVCQSTCATCSDATECSSCNCGYYLDQNKACRDFDECLTSTGLCNANASCTNIPGSYTCTCNVGYYGDGLTCTACQSPCADCSSPTSCSMCNTGYYLDDSNACQVCQWLCATCSDSTSCSSCLTNYYLDQNNACQDCPVVNDVFNCP